MQRSTVVDWLRAYVRAWESYDSAAIGDLFTEDATYRYYPFDEPIRGRDEIVASWLKDRDPAGTYEGSYDPIAIDGDRAVVNGRSRYFTNAARSEVRKEYDNIFVIGFDGSGRCRSFQEWYVDRRDEAEPVT